MSSKALDENVQQSIEELRKRVKNITPPVMYEDTHMFYRFLKARNFEVDKAEAMFRKHLTWRKAFQVDTIMDTFQPKEVFLEYLYPSIVGFDKDGDLVIYSPMGKFDMKTIMKCFTMNNYMKHWIYSQEILFHTLKKHSEQVGQNAYQVSTIINLDKLTLANLSSKAAAESTLKFCKIVQDHLPERLKAVYFINAPPYSVIGFSIIKSVLSNASVQKLHIFGQSGWREALLKAIDADLLPAFLGGNRTDPDGNPLCFSFIKHDVVLSPKYFLTDEERWFEDRSQVKNLRIEPMQKKKVFIEVAEHGSLIQWKYEIKNKDIDFGLFYQNTDNEDEILPIRRVSTEDGTETDFYRAKLLGTYIILFDNSYSWLNSKELHYIVTVVKPKP